MSKEEENDVIYINLPLQIPSGTNTNEFIYQNILLKKLAGDSFTVEPNQFIGQDDVILDNSENVASDYETSHSRNTATKNSTNGVIQSCNKIYQKDGPDTLHEICETSSMNKTTPESPYPETQKKFKQVEGKLGVRYYQNRRQVFPKGPGRPRKDGLIKPRIERLGPFKCSYCNKEFDFYAELRKHEKQHMHEKAYQCTKCSASFNLTCNYRLHMATHEKELQSCPECQKTFSRQASLRSHLMLHCVDDNLLCINCGASIETQALLDQHKRICIDGKFQAGTGRNSHNASSSRFYNKANVQRSKRAKRLSCSVCKKCFKKPSQLERHLRIHTGEKPYKCHICNRGFSQKGSLIIHRVRHSGVRPYSCALCPATFAQKGNLRAHHNRVHPANLDNIRGNSARKVFACQKCSCVFKRLGSLNSHMNKLHSTSTAPSSENSTLNDIKNVMTQLAGLNNEESNKDILQQAVNNSGLDKKDLNNYSIVKQEEATTSSTSPVNNITVFDNLYGDKLRCYVVKQRKVGGIKWRQCNFCTREFRKPSDLIRHLRIHTKEKPFKCPQCLRRFTVKSTLTAHLKTHSGLKTYMCTICQKYFSSHSSLRVHIRLHTGVKPFKCQICEKYFRTLGMLQTHRSSKCLNNNTMKIPNDLNTEQTPATPEEQPQSSDTNNGEQPYYICTTCGRTFKNKFLLKVHLKSHSLPKRFRCLINNCSMIFNSLDSLKSHTDKYHDFKKYICPICQKLFSTKDSFSKHVYQHKQVENVSKSAMDDNEIASPYESSIETHFLLTSDNDFITNGNKKRDENVNNENSDSNVLVQNFNAIDDENINILPISNCVIMPRNLHIFNKGKHCSDEKIFIDNSSGNLYHVSNIMQSNINAKNNEDINLTIDNNVIERSNLSFLTTNNQSALGVTSKPLSGSENTLEAGSEQQVSSLLNNNIQYSSDNCNPIINGTILEQIEPQCKESNESSVKFQNDASNNIFFKKLIINFQNQFDVLCLDGQENALDILEQQNCIQVMQGFTSNQSEVIDNQESSNEYENYNNKQAANINYDTREASQHFMQCDVSSPHEELVDDTQYTEDISQEQSNDHMESVQTNESTFDINHSPEVEYSHISNELVMVPQNIEEKQKEDAEADSDKYLRSKAKTLSASEQAFLDYIYKQYNETAANKVVQYPNKCSYCVKSFKKPSDLIRHIRVHTGEKPFTCQVCHKQFSLKTSLDGHMITHNKPNKTIVCSVCNSTFSTKGSLKVHMRLHTGSRPFECPLCEMTFRTSGHKRAHLLVHYRGAFREGKDPKDVVTRGNKILNIMGSLTNNISNYTSRNDNTKSDSNQIENCFNFDGNSEYFQNKNDEEIPLPEAFGKTNEDNNLIRDSLIKFNSISDQILEHSMGSKRQNNKKSNKRHCEICNKSFQKPSQLIRHQLIHTGERPYQCDICSKTFNQNNALATHMRRHTGLRPHECPYCSKSFTQNGNLKTHIMRAHQGV